MHFLPFLYTLSIAVVALGQITSPSAGSTYEVGSVLVIEWQGDGRSTVTIVLETGVPRIPPVSGIMIASNIQNNGRYPWSIPSSIAPADNYAIVIYSSSTAMTGSNFRIVSAGSSLDFSTTAPLLSPATATIYIPKFANTTTSASNTTTSASNTTTGASNTTTSASDGSSSGTKVGIGVGVTLAVLILIGLVVAALWYRRRQRHTRTMTAQMANSDWKPVMHPNQHELQAIANVYEMEQEKQGFLSSPVEMNKPHQCMGPPTETHELDPNIQMLGLPTESHELDPSSRMLGHELYSNEYPSQYEPETTSKPAVSAPSPSITPFRPASSISRKPVPPSPSAAEDQEGMRSSVSRKPVPPSPSAAEDQEGMQSSVSRKPVVASASEAEDEEGMRILQDRIERIREEKERLQKIQELERLEEETKRAILEKASRRGGSGNGPYG